MCSDVVDKKKKKGLQTLMYLPVIKVLRFIVTVYQLLLSVVDTSRGPADNAGIVQHRTDEMVIRQNKNTMSDGWCTHWCNW